MKVSLIATVFNEADSIEEFLKSIKAQTKKPDETIIVDGGSTDGTQDILKKYPDIKLIVKNGANIPEGRNLAIKNASGEIIVVTDAGCVLKEDWLDKITAPFIKDANLEVVGGYYSPIIGNTILERAQATLYLGRKTESPFFSPSSRSIAFKKEIWEKVGKYTEWLSIGEDSYFNKQWRKHGAKYIFIKDAIVYWEMRKRWSDLIKQYFRYGRGSGICGNKVPFILYPIYLGGLVLALMSIKSPIILYFLVPLTVIYLMKFRIKRLRNIKESELKLYQIPIVWLVDIINNFSTISGHIVGSIIRIFNPRDD